MQATLYFNKSDKRSIGKILQSIATVDIEMKEDTSIMDPTFILLDPNKYLAANYIYVPDLGRYYFINNITLSHQRAFIECHVDVLESYKGDIKDHEVILERQENEYNLYLDDPEFKIYQPTNVMTFNFPKGFDESTQEYLLVVVGRTS